LTSNESKRHDCIKDLRAQTKAKAARNKQMQKQLTEATRNLKEHLAEFAEYEADIDAETEALTKALKEAHYSREHELSLHSQSILQCRESHEGEFSEYQESMLENLDSYFKQAFQDLQDLEVSVLSATKTHWESENTQMTEYLIKSNANVNSYCRKHSPKRFEVRGTTPKANKSFSK
jgi:glycerol-3-phosphate dehydrogenase